MFIMTRVYLSLFVFLLMILAGCTTQTVHPEKLKESQTNLTEKQTVNPPKSLESEQQEHDTTPAKNSLNEIKTLSDFLNSDFCKLYACTKEDSWPLRVGGINNVYGNNIRPPVSIEVQSASDEIKGIGLMFYDRDVLTESDLEVVYKLLSVINKNESLTNVKTYIKEGVETDVHQIMQAPSFTFGNFDVYAGRVGQQIVSLEHK